MTRLRQRMLEDMQLRGLSARTQECYVAAVRQFAEHFHRSPDRLTEEELRSLEDKLCDRIGGIPLQYIAGRQEFYGRYFCVSPAVLIPRPETEYIVEGVLERITAHHRRPLRILDIGTGSGCIAVTLALEIADSQVFAADISEAALHVARENAVALGAQVAFACVDVLDALSGMFDFIVSNPPYVRRDDIHRLQREVREHEPHVALFSPEDELAMYRRLISGAEQMLEHGGHRFVVQFGIAGGVHGIGEIRKTAQVGAVDFVHHGD